MRTVIRTHCMTCGEVEAELASVTVLLPSPDAPAGCFRLDCDGCLTETIRPASRETVAVLRASGCVVSIVVDDEDSQLASARWFDEMLARWRFRAQLRRTDHVGDIPWEVES